MGRVEFRDEIDYPSADVDTVFAMVTDPAFKAAVCEATRPLSHDVALTRGAGGAVEVTVSRTMPATVPDFAKRFVGDSVVIVQTESWHARDGDGSRRADLSVVVTGQPARMTGTMALEPRGSGTRQLITGTVTVSMPFIGALMEPALADGVRSAVDVERRVGVTWLARRSG